MTIIYLTKHNTKPYEVKIENNDLIKVQKYKIIYNDENSITCVKPLEEIFM